MSAIPDDILPPNNRDAERGLLSAMLRNNFAIAEVVQLTQADDFYTFAHARIFEAMVELDSVGKKADLVTIADWLAKKNLLTDAGGNAYLVELFDNGSSASFRQYAEMVRETAVSRRLMHACKEIFQEAAKPTMPSAEILDMAERSILDIAERAVVGQTKTLHESLDETYVRIDERKGGAEHGSGVPTGFLDLDTLLAGFQNSELILLAARPSVGKTAFALSVAATAAMVEKMPVLFVSLEQARVELAERLLCTHARIDGHKMRKGWMNADEMTKILEAGALLGKSPFFIDDTPGQNMLRISANARRLHRRHGIRLVVVDYLQLIDPENTRVSRNEQVAGISRRLKFLARELKVPVLALSQLNRQSEDGAGREPRLSDLRDSGALEQDADTVLLMSRGQGGGNVVEINVAKQRNGPIGRVTLMYVKQFMRFENFAVE